MDAEPEKTNGFEDLERHEHALVGRMTGGLSPLALATAGFDWWTHLMVSPAKQAELIEKGRTDALKLAAFALDASNATRPHAGRPHAGRPHAGRHPPLAATAPAHLRRCRDYL